MTSKICPKSWGKRQRPKFPKNDYFHSYQIRSSRKVEIIGEATTKDTLTTLSKYSKRFALACTKWQLHKTLETDCFP